MTDPTGRAALRKAGCFAEATSDDLDDVLRVAEEVSFEAFQSFLLDHPRAAIGMLRALTLRVREVEQRIDAWMAPEDGRPGMDRFERTTDGVTIRSGNCLRLRLRAAV